MSAQPLTERPRALVVDDAPELRMLLEPLLAREGFEVQSVADGQSCIDVAHDWDPDVIVLDLVLPGIDGLEVCRQVRGFSDAYIVMLTSRDAEVDKVVGLSVGADDYVPKPFSPAELVARLRALLRRPRRPVEDGPIRSAGRDIVQIGDISIDRSGRVVMVNGGSVELTRIEFDLLDTLCTRPRMVFTRAQLLETVWGHTWFGDTHVVDVHMSNLRRKLGDRSRPPRYIQTVRGVGFRMSDGLESVRAS